ncbi:MAG: hypothetical protein ACP5PN_12405 [Steroidobacteraceae bacterium]
MNARFVFLIACGLVAGLAAAAEPQVHWQAQPTSGGSNSIIVFQDWVMTFGRPR